jgi:hypothetical protein
MNEDKFAHYRALILARAEDYPTADLEQAERGEE